MLQSVASAEYGRTAIFNKYPLIFRQVYLCIPYDKLSMPYPYSPEIIFRKT